MKWLPRVLTVGFSLLVVTVASCGSSWSATDLIKPGSCSPPCWRDITPGETHAEEAIQMLRSNPFVDSGSVQVFQISESLRDVGSSITWKGSTGGSIAVTRDGVVSDIFIRGDLGNLPVDDVIALYGTPFVSLRASPDGPLRARFVLFLYYPELGIFLATHFDGPRQSDLVIPSQVSLDAVRYILPKEFYKTLVADPEYLTSWNGYRESSYYCRSSVSPEGVDSVCPPLK